jgi:hypothetical protein
MSGVSRHRHVLSLGVVALAIVTACAPLEELPPESPDGPRIADLAIDPPNSIVGCSVTLRFRFETNGPEIGGGLVRWSVASGKRLTLDRLTLDHAMFDGAASGEVNVPIKLNKVGHYHYRMQIEDSTGRRSNILEADGHAEVSWAWWMPPCDR